MKNTIIDYKDFALRGIIELGSSNAIIKAMPGDMCAFWPISHTKGKVCALIGGTSSLDVIISAKANRYIYPGSFDASRIPKKGDTIFLSSSCQLPRNIVRGDYAITIKPDNADYIVIPNGPFECQKVDYNIAVKYNDSVIFLNITKGSCYCDTIGENDIALVEKELKNWFGDDVEAYYDFDMKKKYAYFTKKIEEIKDIVLETYPTRKYIYERFLDYDAPTKISVDTLLIWSKLDDELREKAIVSSDWKNYPFTVWNFTRKYNMTYGCKTQAFIAVKNYLEDYYSSYSIDRNFVTAKDWNMFQRWIMKITGIPETGGTIPFSIYKNLTEFEKEVLYKRVAVKPYFLDESNENNMRIGDILPEK